MIITSSTGRGGLNAPTTASTRNSKPESLDFPQRRPPVQPGLRDCTQRAYHCVFYWSLSESPVPAAIRRAAHAVRAELCPVRDLSLLIAAKMTDCIVLDVDQLGVPVLNHLRRMRYEGVPAAVMIVARSPDLDASIEAVRSGAWHVFSKPVEEAHFTRYLSKALAEEDSHRRWLAEYHRLKEQWESLTSRERHTVELLVNGLSNKQIAARLGRTVRAVELRRASAMRKLAMDSAAELFRLVLRLHWFAELFLPGT